MTYQDLLQKQLLGNSVQDMLLALVFFVAIFVVLRSYVRITVRKLRATVERTKTHVDDAFLDILDDVKAPIYAAVALYAAARYLQLPEVVDRIITAIFIIVVVYEAIQLLQKFLVYLVRELWLKDGEGVEQMSSILGLIIKIVLWSVGLLLILSNLGVNVTSLIASLGIGGIAVALALQNVLSDMFSSFSIYFDRPFKVGDFIIVGDHMGTVKKIGLKTTRIQSLQGEEIIISNNELTSTRVRNFKQMQKRRVPFTIGVTYDTPKAKLEKIPEIVEKIMARVDNAKLDRAHFKEFGESSLNYEIVYYVLTGDYAKYMDTRQEINLALVEAFEKEGIEFAFPTRTIHLVKG